MTEFAKADEVFRRLEAERNARIHDDTSMQCKVCWYVYNPKEGCPESRCGRTAAWASAGPMPSARGWTGT